MKYRRLGRTGLYVSEMCLGTMTFGGDGFWKVVGQLDQEAATGLVRTALEHGVNFIDTADVYSEGRSEEITGQAIRDLGLRRSDVVVATKVYGGVGDKPNDRGASRGHIMDGVTRSLERLGLDHIDLYQIHGDDRITPVEETLRALATSCARGWSAMSAAPTGRRGRSPRRRGSPTIAGFPASPPCRPTTRSPGATWSATLCR